MNKNKKKKIAAVLVFIISGIIYYYLQYPICGLNKSIETYLVKHNYISPKNALIQTQLNIKDVKIVVFKCNGKSLQYALFKRGLNGRYRFKYITSKDTKMCDSFIIRIKNDYYLVSLGYNPMNYPYIETILSSFNYSPKMVNKVVNILNEKYFIKYKIISNQANMKYVVSEYEYKLKSN